MNRSVFAHLRLTLALWYASIFSLVLLAFVAGGYLLLAHTLVHQVDEANRQEAATLAQELSPGPDGPAVTADFRDEVAEGRTSRGVSLVNVYARDGRLLLASDRLVAPAPGRRIADAVIGGQTLRVLRLGLPQGGTLVVGHDRREIDAAQGAFLRDMAFAVPLALLATLLAGTALAGKAIRPVREAFEQQQRFLADASHELRTPVSILQTQTDVALEDPEPQLQTLLTQMRAVNRTARRMGRLVSDLLFLARADAGLPLDKRLFSLGELAEDIVIDFEPLARKSRATLRYVPATEAVDVCADPDRVTQVLVVLIDNALKYAPGGHVTVRVTGDRHQAAVCVADDGPGVPEAERSRIFTRFYRLDEARSAESPGAGLGLAIATAIAEAHHGKLTLSSSGSRGAEFCLHLPR
ncbi:MAG TPA: HAMP domain-containing sensor histidine kinase [Oscillatoriaceae cyanobacterium]